MSSQTVPTQELADALMSARRTRVAIEPLTAKYPGLSVDDAYAIARRNVASRVDGGARLVGHKIGLTSVAVQQQLGVDQPDYGALLDQMQLPDGATIARKDYLAPKVELELAFGLRDRLQGPGVTGDDVRAATEWIQPAIELVDSAIADWRITLADTVADNASAAAFVLGGERRPIDDLDLTNIEAELWRGDELVESGSTAAVLGDPCVAVAWLANALAPFGDALEAGHVVLSGACTRMVDATPGDRFRGVFPGLGEIALSVSEGGE